MKKRKKILETIKTVDLKKTVKDGWVNMLTGMGMKSRDKTANNNFATSSLLAVETLEDLFESGGIAKQIVKLPADDMTRNWIAIDGDTDNLIINWMDSNLNIRTKLWQQILWSRLYGGAIGVMGLNDGQLLKKPLNENNIKTFEFISVYDKTQLIYSEELNYKDPSKPKFGQPEFYRVQPIGTTTQVFDVHETRVLRLEGDIAPDNRKRYYLGWGLSVLQNVYNSLKNLGSSLNASAHIIEEFIMTILTIDNLMNLLANGQEDLILKRLNQADLSKRLSNTMLLDTNEKFDRLSSNVSGLPDLVKIFIQILSAETGIPSSKLMKETVTGMNSSGVADAAVKDYYADISNKQEIELRPLIQRVIDLTMLTKTGPTNGKVIKDVAFRFLPLWQPTQKEIAETKLINAQTDQIYMQNNVLQPEGVGQARFGGNTYSHEMDSDAIMGTGEINDPEDDDA